MKLPTAKKRKIALIFSGGLGDTILFVPLLKALKKKQFHITCIFYSPDKSDCLLDESLYDVKIHIAGKIRFLLFAITHTGHFINIYINHLAKGKLIALAASICSYRVTQTGNTLLKNTKSRKHIPIETDFSDAEQNLRLLYNNQHAKIKNIQDFYFEHPQYDSTVIEKYFAKSRPEYIVIQVSSGNNNTPYKNWPMQNWLSLLSNLCDRYTAYSFVIIGDESETVYAEAFEKTAKPNCRVLIGKTSIPELFSLLAYSKGYIGLDSGIMHMAVALKKKTLTLFGASNEKLYGYSKLDEINHRVIATSLSCRPCAAWKNANTSRVSDPGSCPDFACMTGIDKMDVFTAAVNHFGLK